MSCNRVSGLLPLMVLALAASLALAGCRKSLEESDIPFVAPMVNNVLAGIAERDYGRFSMDFSDAMKDAITEEGFPSMMAKLDDALGEFKSRTFLRAVKPKGNGKDMVIVSYYRAVYAKDDRATITIYITDRDGKKVIEGFSAAPSRGTK
jgi:hypothetical protein